jgi:hypothetical protein
MILIAFFATLSTNNPIRIGRGQGGGVGAVRNVEDGESGGAAGGEEKARVSLTLVMVSVMGCVNIKSGVGNGGRCNNGNCGSHVSGSVVLARGDGRGLMHTSKSLRSCTLHRQFSGSRV